MNKRFIFWLKALLTVAVIVLIAWQIQRHSWDLQKARVRDWRFIALSAGCFIAFMVHSAMVWRWLTRQMGDRSPLLPTVAAYVYSQMGKYVPGKVVLLLMRLERTGRLGMPAQTCIVSTLLENATYMVSGGLMAILTLACYARGNLGLIIPLAIGVLVLSALIHPWIFYGLLNRVLRKMQRPEVPPAQRLSKRHLFAAVLLFVPCWILAGVSLWAAVNAFTPLDWHSLMLFPGTMAFAITGGMAFVTPGGVGPRDFIIALLVSPLVGREFATFAAVLQRLIQVAVEATLGISGALTSRRRARNGEILATETRRNSE